MTRKRDESEVVREAAAGYGVTEIPASDAEPRRIFGALGGSVAEEGDLVSPTGESWGLLAAR